MSLLQESTLNYHSIYICIGWGNEFRYRHIEVAGETADWVGIDPWLYEI